MPKYLFGKVTVRTFETYADTIEQASENIKKWQQGESEEPEPGIRAVSYKLMWDEFDNPNPTEERNKVLLQFLKLMEKIPGLPSSSIIVLDQPRDGR